MLPKFYHILTAVLICGSLSLCGQGTIEVLPQKNSLLTGEPVKLQITIKSLKADSAYLPDSLGHFEVLARGPLSYFNENGLQGSSQQIVITSFDSGRWQIPTITVPGSNLYSQPFELEVSTPAADSIKPYGEVKELQNLQLPTAWWQHWWIWVVVAILAGLAIYALSRIKKPAAEAFPLGENETKTLSPPAALTLLSKEWEQGRLTSQGLGNGLADIVKQQLVGMGLVAKTKTGEELIQFSKTHYPATQWQQVAQTIRFCDALRFGKFEATIPEGLSAIDVVRHTIIREASDTPEAGNVPITT